LQKKRLEERSDAVFLPVDFEYYTEMSEKAMEIMKKDVDIFEYVGRDEAYLDVTKRVEGDFEKASHLAQQIKNSIRDKIKLSCSVGISQNKLISKIASNYQKPDGLTIVTPEKIEEFLEQLKIRTIPGIGGKTEKIFSEMKVETIQELKKLDVFTLNNKFALKVTTDPVAWEEYHKIAGEIMFLPWLFVFILIVIVIETRRLKKMDSREKSST